MTNGLAGHFWEVWTAGGWILLPLLALAVYLYGFGMHLLGYLNQKPHRALPDTVWQNWIARPEEAAGEVGEIIRYATQENGSPGAIRRRFAEIHLAEFPRIDRRIRFLAVVVHAAPLLGLLGTVFGMFATFEGLAAGGGGVVDRVASGISEALITTEMGLLIAIPGYFLVHAIRRRRNQYEAFLARVESFLMQRQRREAA